MLSVCTGNYRYKRYGYGARPYGVYGGKFRR